MALDPREAEELALQMEEHQDPAASLLRQAQTAGDLRKLFSDRLDLQETAVLDLREAAELPLQKEGRRDPDLEPALLQEHQAVDRRTSR